ncbi:hypothetical protein N7474_001641 [Penicillium riverlandense]|uniref:uncharacterized protein n=1 Tax=Penicillium riverlandense TaxID=1903569 RepID=UPI0025499BCC|nr:uncharacterized protein N7474_001641 [Penicillium riverlandense]KAJ5833330.1 hypothetical protein N7474_001641 [Penicillium riverlandense]
MQNARNLYKNDVDFAALASQSPDFAKQYVNIRRAAEIPLLKVKHCAVSRKSTPSQQPRYASNSHDSQLTTSLLQQDFKLKVEAPDDRLCPPVPNRLNYILWLQDLLDSTGGTLRDEYDREREYLPTAGLYTPATVAVYCHRFDFTMCNPPFYSSRDELIHSAELKARPPFSACTGAEVEMVTHGGEVAFVTRMLEESLRLRDRVRWYTSMLGKLSSVSVIVEKLMKHNNQNYAVTEFVQGSKTKRWAVAWSWSDRRPSMAAARGILGLPKHLLPFPAEYTFTLNPEASIDDTGTAIDAEMGSLPWFWTWDRALCTGAGFASENVWSRQARRKMKLAGQDGAAVKPTSIPDQVALGVRVQARLVIGQKPESKEVQVLISWIQGTDSVLFESFCGMLKRKVNAVA